MTSHIVDKKNKSNVEFEYDEQEEEPEDGIDDDVLEGIEEESQHPNSGFGKRRDSNMSFNDVGKSEAGGDLNHILSNDPTNRRSNMLNNKAGGPQNHSQSSLSKNSSQRNSNVLHNKNSGNSNFNTFVPLSEFQMPA